MTPTIRPTYKQHKAWEKLGDKITEFVVFGGAAGGGKSWLGCEWLLTSCVFYPGTRYFMAREELKDLRESTYISFLRVCQFHGIQKDGLFKYNGMDNFFQFHNGSRIDMVDLKNQPRDPMYERLGSVEYTSGWIEEAGQVSKTAFDIISSRTNRLYNDKYGLLGKTLITCNPKKNFLYSEFYKPWKNGALPGNKAFIQAFVDDNNFGESMYKHKLENLSGVARQRLLLGDWEYNEEENALIEYEKILDCFKNSHIDRGTYYITCDVARLGQDSTVIGIWSGFRVKFYRYEKKLTTEVVEKIRYFQQKYLISTSNIIVDEDGVGGGVVDQLRCTGFVNNSRPLPGEVPKFDEKGSVIPENFDNLRSQCYFKLADLINAGLLYIENPEEEEAERIIQELGPPKYCKASGECSIPRYSNRDQPEKGQ